MTAALPTTYDPLFRKYGNQIPVAYLRALAKRESNMNPNQSVLPAYGLLQVIAEVANDAGFQHSEMFDPEKNVRAATRTLNRIVDHYRRNHNMSPDWTDKEYAKLVTAGWNSGYSDVAGVGKVMHWLRNKGIPVTHDNVLDYAQQAGAIHYLYQNKERTRKWQRSVVDLFHQQPDAPSLSSEMRGAIGFAAGALAGYMIARALL